MTGAGTGLGFGSIDLSKSAAIGSSILAAGNGGTGISALGSGVTGFLATPSSAHLAAAMTDETGSGAPVFATSPTLVTPVLGNASATTVVATSATAGSSSGFYSSSNQPSHAWRSNGAASDQKVWDLVVNASGAEQNVLSWRTVNDPNNSALEFMRVTRGTGTAISSVQFGNGTPFATIPIAANDTMVGKATTDTLTNKTLSGPSISGTIPTFSGNGQAGLGISSTSGALLGDQGSIADVTIQNKSGSGVCSALTGTQAWNCVPRRRIAPWRNAEHK